MTSVEGNGCDSASGRRDADKLAADRPLDAASSRAPSQQIDLDSLIAEFLASDELGLSHDLEHWRVRAGAQAAEFLQFVEAHIALRGALIAKEEKSSKKGMTGADAQTLEFARHAPLANAHETGESLGYFGNYELLEEIGRGGMGIVFRARHRELRRIVALKMILAGQWADESDVARFRAEASAAAKLQHNGIVPIFEFGQVEGQHYYTMAFVEGPSLAERVRREPCTSREAATWVKQIAEAVAHAHSQGIIHRDLKPANVLMTRSADDLDHRRGARGSGWIARVTDFGLAKQMASDSRLTRTGQAVGTPSYMSPEQAAGKIAEVGPASDIYALGAVLYELLVGRPPFRAATPAETLQQVVENVPAPLRLIDATVPADLETICLKCLEKSPEHRYESARMLAEDLHRFLEGEPIRAKGVHLASRVGRALRKLRHEEEFGGWGRAVACAGGVVLAAHLAIFALESMQQPALIAYWLPRVLMFAALFAIFWLNRPHSLLPTNAAERLIWALWSGLFVSLISVNVLLWAAHVPTPLSYAISAVLGGFCFLILGSHLWGGCYAIGAAFFCAAPWLAKFPRIAPLGDGLLWFVSLLILGIHYWPRATRDDDESLREQASDGNRAFHGPSDRSNKGGTANPDPDPLTSTK